MTPDAPVADVRSAALRLISNGVYVLTACGDVIHAATVTWVVQASIQPPMILVALRRNSHLAQAVRKSHRFALNILSASQGNTAEKFFTHFTAPPEAEAVGGESVRISVGRCPLLTEAPAWLECRLAGEPASPGDHSLFLGEVTAAGVRRQEDPMILWNTPWSYGGLRD